MQYICLDKYLPLFTPSSIDLDFDICFLNMIPSNILKILAVASLFIKKIIKIKVKKDTLNDVNNKIRRYIKIKVNEDEYVKINIY